jgi:hypothetical protein
MLENENMIINNRMLAAQQMEAFVVAFVSSTRVVFQDGNGNDGCYQGTSMRPMPRNSLLSDEGRDMFCVLAFEIIE